MKMKKENLISIIWIVLSFMFFLFPLGVFLIGMRLSHNKKELLKGARTALGVAITFFALFFLFAFADYSGIEDLLYSGYFFGLGAVITFVFSLRLRKQGNLYEKYRTAVELHRISELGKIAEAMELSWDTVIRDLRQMINEDIFPEAEIDEERGIFTLRVYTPDNQETRAVQCSSCGATVVSILGRDTVCEYCGSPVTFR